MSTEDAAAVARAWAQATFNQHDLEAAAHYVTPDWVGHWAGFGEEHGVGGASV